MRGSTRGGRLPAGRPGAPADLVGDERHRELLSREQAADRLIDLAYALTAGGEPKLKAAGRRITLPVAGELRMRRVRTAAGGDVELELELTWSTAEV